MRAHLAGRVAQLRALKDAGMTTAEYAVGILAAVTFAGLLIAVIKSPAVKTALSDIISGALSVAG